MAQVINVAIADDHEIVLSGLKEIISGFEGFNVAFVASNGKDLFEKLQAAKQLPDIVVMDISMPVWDGHATLEAIKKDWPDLNVLVLTMHKHELTIIKMLKAGASGYLLKNSPSKELQRALLSIYRTDVYLSEMISSSFYNRIRQSDVIPSLSEREIVFLKHCALDITYKDLAEKIGISERTVAGFRVALFEKLQVNTRAGLVVCAIQMGLIHIE